MNYREALNRGTKLLENENIKDAGIDATLLLEKACDFTKEEYLMRAEYEISDIEWEEYRILIDKRCQRVPLQYITEKQNFYGYDFKVTPDVLIPRQDTEVLVETVLSFLKPEMRVLDMCTGSGCILISLMKECENITGTGADISKSALNIAKENAKNLGVRANWIRTDMFSAVTGKYDIIVSNPPYIPSMEIFDLDVEVKEFEPLSALDGDDDGLRFYRIIANEAAEYLKENGMLFLEIGYNQADDVKKILEEKGFSDVRVKKDLAGLNRVIVAYL